MSAQESYQNSVEEIEVLEGLEPIRRRAHLYVGDLARYRLPSDLILASLCHAIDEAITGNCNRIQIAIEDRKVCVWYNCGISLDIHPKMGKTIAETMFSVLHACHNLKKNFEVGSVYCKLGLAVLNALCSNFYAEIISSGKLGKQTYIKGIAQHPFLLEPSEAEEKTELYFILDNEIINAPNFDIEYLHKETINLAEELGIDIKLNLD